MLYTQVPRSVVLLVCCGLLERYEVFRTAAPNDDNTSAGEEFHLIKT